MLVYEPEQKGADRQLIFESGSSYRVLTNFPSWWQRLTDSELLGLRGD
jgi:hypothetical protein